MGGGGGAWVAAAAAWVVVAAAWAAAAAAWVVAAAAWVAAAAAWVVAAAAAWVVVAGRRRHGMSDIRAKHDIALLGHLDNGLGFYRFSYNGSDKAYVGVMAQEVERVMPEAVARGSDGYLRVNYDQAGLRMQTMGHGLPAANISVDGLRRFGQGEAACWELSAERSPIARGRLRQAALPCLVAPAPCGGSIERFLGGVESRRPQ